MELARRDVIKQVGIDLSAKYFGFGGGRELKQVAFFLDFIKWVLPLIDNYK